MIFYDSTLGHKLEELLTVHIYQQEILWEYLFIWQEGNRNTIDSKIYHRLREKRDRMYEAIEGTFITPDFTEDKMEEIKKMMQEEIEQSE